MDEQNNLVPDVTPEQPVEVLEVQNFETEPLPETVEPAQEAPASDVPAEQVVEPSDTAQAAPTKEERQGAQEVPARAACDSCGSISELFDVPHHQPENATMWHYCARCKVAHEKEFGVVVNLKELALTHPAQADTPRVAGMLHQGMTVEEVKAELDRERQPELEAEVVA